MKLPPVIQLKIDSPDGGDLSGLIFIMQVTSGTKNQFHISLPKTATDGTTQITAEDFQGQFYDHYEMGLMDYNGSVEAARDVVGLFLYDPRLMEKGKDEISAWPLSTDERKHGRSRQERIDYLVSCRNREFDFREQSVRVPPDGVIRVTVQKKTGATPDAM